MDADLTENPPKRVKLIKTEEPEESSSPNQTENIPCDTPVDSDPIAKYSQVGENFGITPEEIHRLKQFHVLDEVGESNDVGEDDENASNSADEESNSGVSVCDDIPDEEVEAMLDDKLPDWCKEPREKKEKPYEFKRKTVLEEKGINHFEVLPSGWVAATHCSGMPLYLHKPTRVCTMSKPYLLGTSSVRRHDIPVSAIPCLNYRKALVEEEQFQKKETEKLNAILKTNGYTLGSCRQNGEPIIVNSIAKQKPTSPLSEQKLKGVKRKKPSKARNGSKTKAEFALNCDKIDGNNSEANVINSTGTDEATMNDGLKAEATSGCDDAGMADSSTSQINGHCEATAQNSHGIVTQDESNCCSADTTSHETPDSSISKPAVTVEADSSILVGRPLILPGGIMMPTAKIETTQENWKKSHLSAEEVTDYCKKLFKFKVLSTMKFTSWVHKRKFTKMRKVIQRQTLPDGTKLISFPVRNTIINTAQDGTAQVVIGAPTGRQARTEWIMNPNGRSFVCIFHEYVQRVLKDQPTYVYEELENAATPYLATVLINGVQYGVGYGTSKRQAKSAAAKASLEILMPEMKDKIAQDGKIKGQACRPQEDDFTFFNQITINDPRIAEFCDKMMEPSPHSILETCLLRNFGSIDREIKCEVKAYKHKRIAFTMTVGKHTATIICQNKKDGKQRASQAILQALHPHITSWGSLLRLYGSRSVKNFKEKKQEEQEITLLQSKAAVNQPNFAILSKLKTEMNMLHQRDSALVPIGEILVQEDLPLHSGSNLMNVDL